MKRIVVPFYVELIVLQRTIAGRPQRRYPQRFDNYKPTDAGGSGLTAGPKNVHFDRVEWRRIPDPGTAAAALQLKEVDWVSDPGPDVLELLARMPDVTLGRTELLPTVCVMRPNFLHPPFDNKQIRQALLPAINQADFVIAAVGIDKKMLPDRHRLLPTRLADGERCGPCPATRPA